MGALTLLAVKKSQHTLQSSSRICGSAASMESTKCGWCNTLEFVTEKNLHISGRARFKPLFLEGQLVFGEQFGNNKKFKCMYLLMQQSLLIGV